MRLLLKAAPASLAACLAALSLVGCEEAGTRPGNEGETQRGGTPQAEIQLKENQILALSGMETEPFLRSLAVILSGFGARYDAATISQALDEKFEIYCQRSCEIKLRPKEGER